MSSFPDKPLCIIPARGSSKRLPRKNIALLRGKPLLAYTVEAALQSQAFDRVLVSTEDEEIAQWALHYGAEVSPRPADLATDVAQVRDVCLNLLRQEESQGRPHTTFCCLYATAPLCNPEDIQQVLGLIEPGRCDFALAVTHYDIPPHQALIRAPGGELRPMWPELVELRSQELPELVVDNGSIYAAVVSAFRTHRTFYGPGLRGYLMPRERSVDINTTVDLELVRFYADRLGL